MDEWETGVAALPDSKPLKAKLLELAFNTSMVVDFSGTPIKTVAEAELIGFGLPTSRQVEIYGVHLTALNLSRCSLSGKAVEVLGGALAMNGTLRKVWLNGNPLGPPGVRAIAVGITRHPALMSLNLSATGMTIGAGSRRDELNRAINTMDLTGVEALAHMLSNNRTLTRLNLAKNGLESGGLDVLLPALRMNSSLLSLSLANNYRSGDALLFIGRALKSTKTLRKLDLRSNPTVKIGPQMLANALKQNRSLTHLNLRNASLDLSGLRVLVNAVRRTSLYTLDLSFNDIGSAGCACIKDLIEDAPLINLNLSHCSLTDKGAQLQPLCEVLTALRDNRTLATLDLSNNVLVKVKMGSRDNRDDDYTVIVFLAEAMAENGVLAHVNLTGNDVKRRGQLYLEAALARVPCGIRFAEPIQKCLDAWIAKLLVARSRLKAGVSRYDAASLSWMRVRLVRTVLEFVAEPRVVLY